MWMNFDKMHFVISLCITKIFRRIISGGQYKPDWMFETINICLNNVLGNNLPTVYKQHSKSFITKSFKTDEDIPMQALIFSVNELILSQNVIFCRRRINRGT